MPMASGAPIFLLFTGVLVSAPGRGQQRAGV